MKRGRKSRRSPRERGFPSAAPSTKAAAVQQGKEPWWLLASAIALFVARPFVPGVAIAQEGYGALFVFLWLLLLAVWLLERLRRLQTRSRARLGLDWLDAIVLTFFAVYFVSGVIAAVRGSPRPAVNVAWHWLSVGVAYFIFRQLLVTDVVRRGVVAVLIGLAVAMAMLGLEQAMISLPEARAEYMQYQNDPQQLYVRTGQWLPEGSAARLQFEARLESAEPTATFALSNSLAALLVPAIALLVGILAKQLKRRRANPDHRPVGPGRFTRAAIVGGSRRSPVVSSHISIVLSAAVLLGALGVCLVFTHSRSGVVAAFLAAFVVATRSTKRPVVWLVCGGAVACMGSVVIYLFQREAFHGAATSLAYRLEYWQATWTMIGDFPLFGCGPGQFQDTYTAYKLPAASEEVADPHNFLLEVWSTGGTLAAAALAASLITVAWRVYRAARPAARNGPTAATSACHGSGKTQRDRDGGAASEPADVADQYRLVYFGAAGGVMLGALAAWLDGVPLSGLHILLALASLAATLAILHRWIRYGHIPAYLPAVAAGGLLLHLTVSGGIGEPALASELWLLAILQISPFPASSSHLIDRSPAHRRRIASGAAVALAAVFALASYLTYYRPVVRAAGELAAADAAAVAGQSARHLQAVEAAVAADPWSIEAARRLAAVRFAHWQEAPATSARDAWQRADEHVQIIAPRRHSVWRESAERYTALFHHGGDASDLERALEGVERAIALYPTHADHWLFYAERLLEADRTDEAREALAAAVRFDRAKKSAGHLDRTLPADRLATLRELSIALDVSP